MKLIVDMPIDGAAFVGANGPAEAARILRRLADEIEAKVPDFSACRPGQPLAVSQRLDSGIAYLVDQ